MKISREWLKDYVDLGGISDAELAARLTEIGHAIESIEQHGDDTVFDIEFTSNRVDAMSHFGLARELAAATTRQLKPPAPRISRSKPDGEVKIYIEAPDLCTRYTGVVIHGVTVRESDSKIRRRLEAVGLRPINNLVDATNYVMAALGHPLHAFDLKDIAQKTIRVRRGNPNEKITTLDGVVRSIDGQTCVIADAERAVALGGVIGGANSEISTKTRDVLLECAHFSPWAIRRTAKRLGIKTDASYRFERGVDPGDTALAAAVTAELIVAQAGGTLGDLIDVVGTPPHPRVITLTGRRLREISAGVLELPYALALFRRLGFGVEQQNETLVVTVPSYRNDLSEEDDLLEEALRFYGYNEIPAALPRLTTGDVRTEPIVSVEERVRDLMVSCGFTEVISYSFVHPDHNRLFSEERQVGITNALTENIAAMRLSIFPGLLEAVAFNRGYENRDGAIFEVGRTYHWADGAVRERHLAAFVAWGNATTHWGDPHRPFDYFDAKGVLEAVARTYHLDPTFAPISRPWLKEGLAGAAAVRSRPIAIAGFLTREVLHRFDIKGLDVIAGEIDLAELLAAVQPWTMQPVSRYPGVPKVLAFLHPPELQYAEVLSKIESMKIPHLQEVGIWDRFVPEGSGEVKTALGMWYQAFDRSLTQEEVTEIHQQVGIRLARELPVKVTG